MNINEFAESLNGRSEGEEITEREASLAKDLGFVVVFGYSDDNVELRGAIDDEIGIWGSGEVCLDPDGVLERCDCECKYFKAAMKNATILSVDNERGEYFWKYNINGVPFATFDVLDEEGNKWCQGIVFELSNLKK